MSTALETARDEFHQAWSDGASPDAIAAATDRYLVAKRAVQTDAERIAELNRQADAHGRCADSNAELSSEFYDKAAVRRVRATKMEPGPFRDAQLRQASEHQQTSDAYQDACDGELLERMRLLHEAALIEARAQTLPVGKGVVQ